ncbi:hypothetical protein V1507DRAFT_324602 [Lipomyces tetrasporus]
MTSNRAKGRNVHLYVFSEPDKPIGGLKLNPSVTERSFLYMLRILIVATGPYRVTLRSTGDDVMPTEDALKPGHYDLRPYSPRGGIYILFKVLACAAINIFTDKIALTDEPCITRILSRTNTGRDEIFRARVRARDGKCVITGTVNINAPDGIWGGFEAAHIFPLSSEDYWVQNGYSQLVTIE